MVLGVEDVHQVEDVHPVECRRHPAVCSKWHLKVA